MTPFTQEELLQRVVSYNGILPIISHSKVTTEIIYESVEDVWNEYQDWDDERFSTIPFIFPARNVIMKIIEKTGIPYTMSGVTNTKIEKIVKFDITYD